MSDDVPATATSVQLTRMEGTLNLIDYKVDNLVVTVGLHETAIANLQLKVASLDQQAVAREETVLQTAKALKDAKEAEMAKDEHKWSLSAKVSVIASALAALAIAYANYRPH